jgi:glycosyltransferase involved in cell wall biosynthesis
MPPILPYRIGLQQRVFPAYRAPFFDALAASCVGGLSIFSGEPMTAEALGKPGALRVAQHVPARNQYLGWGPFLMVWQSGLIDWLERWNPDVLVMESNPRNISTNAALRWMHARRRPVIGWGLGAPPVRGLPAFLTRAFEASRRGFLGQFDALISYSKTGVAQFAAAGYPAGRVFVAPNAATPRPAPLPERSPTFRPAPDGERRGAPQPVVLFVGRLQPRKRVDALLRACAALPADLRPRVLIVGDGPAREDLEAVARECYPAAQFAGEKHDAELEPYFAAADLFVLPGTGGLAVQQAMSRGLPVIVAEADGTQSDLVRAENGWVLPPNDDAALLRTLATALADPLRLRQMGRESYRIVDEEVNLEKMVEVFARVIEETKEKKK